MDQVSHLKRQQTRQHLPSLRHQNAVQDSYELLNGIHPNRSNSRYQDGDILWLKVSVYVVGVCVALPHHQTESVPSRL